MSGAFLLVTVATILFGIGNSNNSTNTAENLASRGISIGLLVFAATISCYAVGVYYRRIRLLEAGQPHGYHERHGPVLLAVALLVGIAMLLWTFQTAFAPVQLGAGRPVLRPDQRFCTRHELRGINLLQFQPSDVLPLADRPGVLIVPSLTQITSISVVAAAATATPAGATTTTGANVSSAIVTVLADIAGADFEAVVQTADGRIFAISEGGDKKSTLLEFQWQNSNNKNRSTTTGRPPHSLELVSSVRIATPYVEGLALVDHDLYVAGNVLDERNGYTVGSVDVYTDFMVDDHDNNDDNEEENGAIAQQAEEEDHNKNSTTTATNAALAVVRSGHRLNAKLLNQGLLDSKIGSLYYFEGILYILYDNAQIVRGWHLESSELVLEWLLPVIPVSSSSSATTMRATASSPPSSSSSSFRTSANSNTNSFDKQWEGLALERRDSDQQLVLYLTLDSPPQVRTIQLIEEQEDHTVAPVGGGVRARRSYPSLPACAA
jgi:hypothetical protein